ESNDMNGKRMCVRGENLSTGVNFPHLDRAPLAGASKAGAVWAKCQGAAERTCESVLHLPGRRVPNLDIMGSGACGMFAIEANIGIVSSERQQLGMAKPPKVVPFEAP